MIFSILKTIAFRLQSCLKFDFKPLFDRKFYKNIASLGAAKGVPLQAVTIAIKILRDIDHFIKSLYTYYLYKHRISIEDTCSSSSFLH